MLFHAMRMRATVAQNELYLNNYKASQLLKK
jgi:hypothetical protein